MIRNLTPGIRDLLPNLMGGARNLEDDQFPGAEVLRPVHAQSGTRSSYVVPANFPEEPQHWFSPKAPTYPLRQGNDVELLIDGEDTYEAMVEAIETATGPDHFIVLVAWAAHFDFQLTKNGSRAPTARRTAGEVFGERAALGVKIRLLLWNNTAPMEVDAFGSRYSKLTKLAADKWNDHAPDEVPRRSITIVDDGTRTMGSHHQKILLVYGEQGLVGFAGGLDFNSDRVNQESLRLGAGPALVPVSGPLHDVHVRLRGEAADDLLVLAVNRWNFSRPIDVVSSVVAGTPSIYRDPGLVPPSASLPATGREIEDLSHLLRRAREDVLAPPTPHHLVQIAQTVGNPGLAEIQNKNGVLSMIKHAIGQSRRFIYIEDQYFWSKPAAQLLLDAIDRVHHVTVLMPSDDAIWPLVWPRRAVLRDILKQNPTAHRKLRLYERVGARHAYIHAKMSIYDDQFVIVGSANWNDRGFFYDSEVVATIADPRWSDLSGPRFGAWYWLEMDAARKLRMRLWSEHLGVPTDQLGDGVAAELYWRDPPAAASIRPHKVNGVPWYESRVVAECGYEQGDLSDQELDPGAGFLSEA